MTILQEKLFQKGTDLAKKIALNIYKNKQINNKILNLLNIEKHPLIYRYEYEDILQASMEGLWRAVIKIRPSELNHFNTYACKYIQKSILKLLKSEQIKFYPVNNVPISNNLEDIIFYKEALNSLDPELRTIFVRIALYEERYSQIAKDYDNSTTNIYKKYQEAKNLLREYMAS